MSRCEQPVGLSKLRVSVRILIFNGSQICCLDNRFRPACTCIISTIRTTCISFENKTSVWTLWPGKNVTFPASNLLPVCVVQDFPVFSTAVYFLCCGYNVGEQRFCPPNFFYCILFFLVRAEAKPRRRDGEHEVKMCQITVDRELWQIHVGFSLPFSMFSFSSGLLPLVFRNRLLLFLSFFCL